MPRYSISLMRQKILKPEQMQGTSTPTLNSIDSEEVNIHCHRTADTRKESGYYTQCPWVAERVRFPQGKSEFLQKEEEGAERQAIKANAYH